MKDKEMFIQKSETISEQKKYIHTHTYIYTHINTYIMYVKVKLWIPGFYHEVNIALWALFSNV